MKKIITLFVILCMSRQLLAQQEAMYTQYMFNMMAVNPAYAGSRGVLSATAMYRNQWVGVEGAPRTGTLSFDMATRNKKVGLGIQAFNDRIGIVKTTGFYASYAYRINFNENGSALAIGLQGGLSNYRADLTKVELTDGGDPAFMQNINAIMPSFGAGIFYNTPKFYAGFSVPNLVKSYLRKDQYLYSTEVVAKKYMHLFLVAGYVFDLNENLKLKPSFLVKAVRGAPVVVDVNANFWIKEIVGIGASYRTGDAIAGLLELQLSNQFRLGYAYDHSISNLVKYNQGTHEIMLRYEFGWDRKQVVSPRFF
ncbi:type IX secretion system membrane protein PorP/SprF [Chitinophaga sp. YIM B06452]|uniref:PorP/SprF family type IX secretion system membrane protein n=1 Tax=Chitinophaga sp. YIM B06452 TaxID=3082158 RepID=UPI0031FEDE45